MSRRQALNVAKGGYGFVVVQPEQQEVGDGGIVEFAGNIGMGSYAIEGVAEQKEILQLRVVERFDAEVIAGAEQQLIGRIPNGEREIAAKMVDAIRAPSGVTPQDQFGIGRGFADVAIRSAELTDQVRSLIEARVSGQPQPIVKPRRLPLSTHLRRCLQQRVPEANFAVVPDSARVRPAVRYVIGKRLQEPRIDRRAVLAEHSDNAAQ